MPNNHQHSRLFTSESVSEGHPDKVADQISDALLDHLLTGDPDSRAALETLVKTDVVVIAGELRSDADISTEALETVVRNTVTHIGYDNETVGLDGQQCRILNFLGAQSADIALGVDADTQRNKDQGAGDQGMMFGYASDETKSLMPAPIHYAHALVRRQAECRRNGTLAWLRPDAKSQVSVRYERGVPVAIEAVVLSTQHDPEIGIEELRIAVREQIIAPVLPAEWLNTDTQYHINPTGRFVIGGPMGDCGLTGRKIIVDTYGGMARHGGGAFSGKDPSKVDRSAAYVARYAACNVVAAGLAHRCEVQLSYAIGVAEPVAVAVDSFGTGQLPDDRLTALVREHFSLRPAALSQALNLKQQRYQPVAAYGHFGRPELQLPWEDTTPAATLANAAGMPMDRATGSGR